MSATDTGGERPLLGAAAARYRVVKCLGSGGMGDVYLAEDTKLGRHVAIKTVREDLCANEEVSKRIERECLLHAKVGAHPNIVTLYDILDEDGRIHLVMEYVEGQSLQSRLDENAQAGLHLPLDEALTIIQQCFEGLGRIHAHGIVHRDLKPSNIMLVREEGAETCAKLMDFGIARLLEGDEQLTEITHRDGRGPGTPLYMAPEQIDSHAFGPVSPATDIYAMGVMLYQLAAGKPPFSGSITEIFNGHLNRPAPPVAMKGAPALRDALDRVFQKALAKHPRDRYPTAKSFRDDILAAFSLVAPPVKERRPSLEDPDHVHPPNAFVLPTGEPVDPESRAQAVRAEAEQHMRAVWEAVVGLVVLVALAAGVVWGAIRLVGQGPPAEVETPQEVTAPTAVEDRAAPADTAITAETPTRIRALAAQGAVFGSPGRWVYVVQPGDSVYRIAQKAGVEEADLVRWNDLRHPATITTGQELRLYDPAAAEGGQR